MSDDLVRATPFHARAAEANRGNIWENRGGFTLATAFNDWREEALAARFGVVMADVSWHWRARIAGQRADEFVSRLFTRDATKLAADNAVEALWLNDAGGVRGAGLIVRLENGDFLLDTAINDAKWMIEAAALYDVTITGVSERKGVLAFLGPTSASVLAAAGLPTTVENLTWCDIDWRGLSVTLSRFGQGFELWCDPDDALIVWDRIVKVGRPYALTLAGQAAMDALNMERGNLRAMPVFAPARDRFSRDPSPQALGLAGLVDRGHVFNGRGGFLAAPERDIFAGILLDSENPAPHAVITHKDRPVGQTLASLYSPALRRAVALAALPPEMTAQGIELMAGDVACRACGLPFLPIPAPIPAATETAF